MSLDERLRHLAEQQYALVSREQTYALGAARWDMARRVRGGTWEQPTARVYRLVGAPQLPEHAVMVAVLDAGPDAVASHESAAALWQLPGFTFASPEVSRTRALTSRVPNVGMLHHARYLPGHHVTVVRGIPVTTLGRTLFDLAGRLHPGRLERLVDTVSRKSPGLLRSLHLLLDDLAASGRNGIVAMRTVLDERPAGYVAFESGLERRFAEILAEAGEPPLERQVDLGGHDWIGRVDFFDRDVLLIVEIDSDLHHTSRLDVAHDNRRDRALIAAGFRMVVHVSEHEIWYQPDRVVARVRGARRELRRVAG